MKGNEIDTCEKWKKKKKNPHHFLKYAGIIKMMYVWN